MKIMKKGSISILVCMLMIISTIIPVSATTVSEKPSHPLTMGNILYVGGSGPNNYTKIQDAINNATEGDTVFVYDDSSPYVENIVINISISLLGEDREKTIINGSTNGPGENFTDYIGVSISADNVTVRGFTIQSCDFSGIAIYSNHTRISDTILSDNDNYGIVMGSIGSSQPSEMSGYNTISNNLIIHNMVGMWVSGRDNIIRENVISQNVGGIAVVWSMSSNISHNIISKDTTGVYISESYNTVLYRNNISYNEEGVFAMLTSSDKILQNNFIENNKSAYSAQMVLILFNYKYKGEIPFPIRRNVWNENYWDRPRLFPYKIPGMLRFWVDWHPAQEPYDIGV